MCAWSRGKLVKKEEINSDTITQSDAKSRGLGISRATLKLCWALTILKERKVGFDAQERNSQT